MQERVRGKETVVRKASNPLEDASPVGRVARGRVAQLPARARKPGRKLGEEIRPARGGRRLLVQHCAGHHGRARLDRPRQPGGPLRVGRAVRVQAGHHVSGRPRQPQLPRGARKETRLRDDQLDLGELPPDEVGRPVPARFHHHHLVRRLRLVAKRPERGPDRGEAAVRGHEHRDPEPGNIAVRPRRPVHGRR